MRLWQKIRTHLDPDWDRAYEQAEDDLHRAQGGRIEIHFQADSDQTRPLVHELRYPHAHPLGQRPFGRAEAEHKFERLSEPWLDAESRRGFLGSVARLDKLAAGQLGELLLPSRACLRELAELNTASSGIF